MSLIQRNSFDKKSAEVAAIHPNDFDLWLDSELQRLLVELNDTWL